MSLVYSKALDKSIEVDRLIGRIDGNRPGPTLVFFGGIHGNEPSGVFALRQVVNALQGMEGQLRGRMLAVAGNLSALEQGKRYHVTDLNRLWKSDRVEQLNHQMVHATAEAAAEPSDTQEQLELYDLLQHTFQKESGPFYFFDLHTTSAETNPFIFINDTLYNRKVAMNFPVPIILGIEEFIDGPLLSWINESGYLAIGFESGQHDSLVSIENHVAFIWLALAYSGCLMQGEIEEFHNHHARLARSSIGSREVFEIRHRYEIVQDEKFVMNPGYLNFQRIKKGEELAYNQYGPISAKEGGKVFMPLYQAQGEDGYFIIRKIQPIWLRLSAVMRKWKLEALLALLPGVKRASDQQHVLEVDKRVARFLATQLFHLLGYRRKQKTGDVLVFIRREFDTKGIGDVQY